MKEILCFGDSNTYGLIPGTTSRFDRDTRWTGILESELFSKGYKIVEEGLCGRTTIFEDELRDNRRGVDMLPALLESHNPIDYVILMLGTNDCKTYYNASAGLIGKGIEKLIAQIKSYNSELGILLMSPIVLGDEVWKPEYDPEFNKTSVKTSHKLKDVYKKIAKKYGRYKNDAVPREDMFVMTDISSEYFKSINEKEKNVVVHDNLDPVEFLKMDFSEETINEHDDEEEYLMSMIDSLSSDEMDDIINEEEEATRRAKFEEFLQDYDLMSIVQIYSSELIEPERKKAIIELEKLGIDEDKIKNEVYPEIPLSEVLENVRMVRNYYAAVNS